MLRFRNILLVGSVVSWTVWFLSCHCLFNFVCWIPQCVLPLSCCQQNTSSNRSCKALGQMRGRGCALVMFMPLTTKEIKLPTLNSIVCIFFGRTQNLSRCLARRTRMITRLKIRGSTENVEVEETERGEQTNSESLLHELFEHWFFASREWDVTIY